MSIRVHFSNKPIEQVNKYENKINLRETHKDDTTRMSRFVLRLMHTYGTLSMLKKEVTLTFWKIVCDIYDDKDK